MNQFLNDIASAKALGEEWVETSPEVIAHFNRRGLGVNPVTGKQNRFFLYEGIKIAPTGQTEEIEAEMNRDLEGYTGKGVLVTGGGQS